MRRAKMLWVPFLILLTAGCGGRDAAEEAVLKGPRAGIAVDFQTSMGNIIQGHEIYVSVQNSTGRSLYNTTSVTNENGIATFDNLPAGPYKLEFRDKDNRRGFLDVDLSNFTGDDYGKPAGSVVL